MTGGREDDTSSTDTGTVSGAPVDFDRLAVIEQRLATDDRFTRSEKQPDFAADRLVCIYDSDFYPSTISTTRLEIVWFENGDFTLHYHETHDKGSFDHRWDRHPSDHNTRDHIHPGPNAPTPGDDVGHPDDWRDVLSMVLTEIEERQRGFW
jgi:hypothetical protein